MNDHPAHLEPLFGRHETFAPRYGWFKKAQDALVSTPTVFLEEDATLRLGVGKNMVRSMRFWSGAAGLITPRKQGTVDAQPSHLANVLLGNGGWDPYLEYPASTWLLHWRLLSPGCHLPVWWFAFNDFSYPEFSVATLSAEAHRAMTPLYGIKEPAASSVKRDSECLVQTYVRKPSGKTLADDVVASPFRTLGLLEAEVDRSGVYRFRVGPKPTLPAPLVLFASLEFSARLGQRARSVSLGRLLRDAGSPGRSFKLDEDSLLAALFAASAERDDVWVTDTAGVSALQFQDEAEGIAVSVLNAYYRKATGSTVVLKHLRDEDDLLAAAVGPAPAVGPRLRKPRSPRT